MVIRSVVNGLSHAPRYCFMESGLLGTHTLSLPLDDGRMHCRIWSLFDDLLLAQASVLELCVTAEVLAFFGTGKLC